MGESQLKIDERVGKWTVCSYGFREDVGYRYCVSSILFARKVIRPIVDEIAQRSHQHEVIYADRANCSNKMRALIYYTKAQYRVNKSNAIASFVNFI